MIERRPVFDIVTHAILLLGVVFLLVPVWLAIVAASQDIAGVNHVPINWWFGSHLFENLGEAWRRGDFGARFVTSFVVAFGVMLGKITVAALAAFAIVFFDWRARMAVFWLIFVTLMLPLEVRIVPTYAVAANALRPFQAILDMTGLTGLVESVSGLRIALQWRMLNSYAGLILPLVATATGTFLYRQFFMTVPEDLVEAAKMDGAGPLRFFWDVLLPLSRTNIAALATIMFVYAWNQYLWPLLVTTEPARATVLVELSRLVPRGDGLPEWHILMAATLIVMLPPLFVVLLTQRWFVRGLIATEK
ncbi:SN-glycerol-3-phosphate transport system permease protein ugpE (plasmid) [Roseomonas mucosa]|uniref:sn-glycerol-3-phosphate transport system permease protein UgpE n=1 Tax=Roseomonas mucosa TaxID=207340 RepID=A0A4Y1MR48_9PROT|nr:ABC transporter permease subunit [Roseomonas mucosa]AWV20446.1 SN-glycerol-3-phosphate transport system permease protein ugpE [Roseomonas mucosa]MDT8277905.1 ABC transporter permease subunit [Roseomonas mucosa]MDT8356656.1 ABC transporter permease subunit [Roseomonas mucosa]QDJ11638.1 SN-glycerol-3-phosphate transport system permease protein ugpE [Roseomonas mucosa]